MLFGWTTHVHLTSSSEPTHAHCPQHVLMRRCCPLFENIDYRSSLNIYAPGTRNKLQCIGVRMTQRYLVCGLRQDIWGHSALKWTERSYGEPLRVKLCPHWRLQLPNSVTATVAIFGRRFWPQSPFSVYSGPSGFFSYE